MGKVQLTSNKDGEHGFLDSVPVQPTPKKMPSVKEMLRKSNEHGEMWWPKLFVHHGGIAWDDFDKDYSDLPHEILARHRRIEAEREHQSQLDQAERNVREALTERDECRKRARQERLHELRTGSRKSWVYLNRENPNESEIGRYREEEAKRKSNQALIAT